jgi:hypothetical protein
VEPKRLLVLSLVAGLLGACNEENPPPPWRHDAGVPGADLRGVDLRDGGCARTVYYLDSDGDGYGDPTRKQEACLQPAGHVTNSLDCNDLDPAAHPGQTAFFSVPSKGTTSFDYDCDTVEQMQDPSLVSCVSAGMNCQGSGWVDAIPACGQPGTFATCTKPAGRRPGCGQATSSKSQSCN